MAAAVLDDVWRGGVANQGTRKKEEAEDHSNGECGVWSECGVWGECGVFGECGMHVMSVVYGVSVMHAMNVCTVCVCML